MSNLNSIKMASCMLECAGIKGSGFFITPNLVLTCLHNLSIGQQVTGERPGEQKETFEFEVLDQDAGIDLSLLKVINNRESLNTLHVCSLEPVAGIEWESYGYPDTTNGRAIGESLTGDIRDYAEYTAGLEHDVVLNVTGYNVQTSVYDGFSGSPLVDDYGNVFAVFRFSGHNSLDAVSIKRAKPFLEKNNILCKQDYLLDFEEYACNCFAGFEDDPKRMCNAAAIGIKDQVKPDSITRDLLGKLYYPHNKDSLEDIIVLTSKRTLQPTADSGKDGWNC
ncbi:hypothetical protein DBR43_03245 [Pedobacter sp. KBW06]|uniref:S1 family peptidase n=1 Tax=Pedobacter sp. KBW06 TaxID=2153359 RepID=UPI000F596455|nr:serine protease [Pedobacter sp. KBW06]RQO74424.1 hypothetical protein DBR43_03245 [Pedobacter sp. KBW06]